MVGAEQLFNFSNMEVNINSCHNKEVGLSLH